MLTSHNRFSVVLISFSILALIASKLLPIYHYSLFDNFSLDIDRLAALSLFLLVFFSRIEKLEKQPFVIFFMGTLALVLLGIYLDIAYYQTLKLLILTALVEEILLRGVVFHLMMKWCNKLQTILLSSLIFTLVHPAVYSDWVYGVLVLLTGMLLGAIYIYYLQKSRQLAIVMATLIHMGLIIIALKQGLI